MHVHWTLGGIKTNIEIHSRTVNASVTYVPVVFRIKNNTLEKLLIKNLNT